MVVLEKFHGYQQLDLCSLDMFGLSLGAIWFVAAVFSSGWSWAAVEAHDIRMDPGSEILAGAWGYRNESLIFTECEIDAIKNGEMAYLCVSKSTCLCTLHRYFLVAFLGLS